MSKKQMLPFLTEWLITHGTSIVDINKFETFPMTMLIKSMRLGYLVDVSVGQPMLMKLTKEGIRYLQENQK
jgi:hypothetical protein